MGQFTPYIGLYIPVAGETNYDDSFASGMINLDQHDHSGGPNKGVPITSSGLADFSVTYNKLAANVADITTGIGVNSTPGLQNQLQILGALRNLFTLGNTAAIGFVTMNGSAIAARTFQNSTTITWTNADGTGNPSAAVNIGGLSPIGVANGGTGLTSLTPYAILAGGTGATTPVQQVSGLGTSGQVLTSNGAATLPTWQTPTPFPAQNLLIATLSLTATQFCSMNSSSASNITIIPSPGAGKAIVVYQAWGKVVVGTDRFHDGSSVRLYYGNTSNEVGFVFKSGTFTDSTSGFYYADNTNSSSTSAISTSTMENRAVTVGVNSTAFTTAVGSTSTASFFVAYSIMQI